MKKSEAEKKNTNILLAAFVIFIVPIILVLSGVFIGEYIGKTFNISITASQIGGGVGGFLISGILIKAFDKRTKADESAEKIHWDDL